MERADNGDLQQAKAMMRKIRTKFFLFLSLILTGAFLLQGIVAWAGFSPSSWALRQMYEVRGPRAVPDELLLVLLTDRCLQELELSRRTPLPDELLKAGVKKALQGNAGTIFLDTNLFPTESSRKGFLGAFEEARVFFLNDLSSSDSSPLEMFSQAMRDDQDIEIFAPKDSALLNFYGPPATVPMIRLSAVLGETEGDFDNVFKNKVVLFGLASLSYQSGQRDSNQLYVSSSKERMFEVEFQATLLGNLLDRSWIREIPLSFALGILVITGVIVSYIALNLSFKLAMILLLSFCFFVVFVLYLAFTRLLLWSFYSPVLVMIPLLALLIKGLQEVPGVTKRHARLKDDFSLD